VRETVERRRNGRKEDKKADEERANGISFFLTGRNVFSSFTLID